MKKLQIFIGFEQREHEEYGVLVDSIRSYNKDIKITAVDLSECRFQGLYTRPTVTRNGKLYDVISKAPMSTEFAISRFLVPFLADPSYGDYALFIDCDFMATCNIEDIMNDIGEGDKPMYCVKHDAKHEPGFKMDGCIQTDYHRKNWSSAMIWNLGHESNKHLSLWDINNHKGLDLHQFCWLDCDEIGELPKEWNHLVGVDEPNYSAKLVHYTLGSPNMRGYEGCEYSDAWREHLVKNRNKAN